MRTLLFGAFVLVGALAGRAQPSVPLREVSFEYREGLIWIEVDVAGSQEPLRFLLDSGAQVSVINLDTAKRLGLSVGPGVRVRGVHQSVMGYWPLKLKASVKDVPLPSNFLALDLSKLSRSCKWPVDGLIGADFFHQRIVQIDFSAKKVRILPSAPRDHGTESLPLTIRSSGMFVQASVNGGKPQRFRVDTGCATPLQWVTRDTKARAASDRIAVALTEFSISQTRTDLGIGDRVFRNIPTGLHRKPIFHGEAGLLGNGLFTRFEWMIVDARSRHLRFGPIRDFQ